MLLKLLQVTEYPVNTPILLVYLNLLFGHTFLLQKMWVCLWFWYISSKSNISISITRCSNRLHSSVCTNRCISYVTNISLEYFIFSVYYWSIILVLTLITVIPRWNGIRSWHRSESRYCRWALIIQTCRWYTIWRSYEKLKYYENTKK